MTFVPTTTARPSPILTSTLPTAGSSGFAGLGSANSLAFVSSHSAPPVRTPLVVSQAMIPRSHAPVRLSSLVMRESKGNHEGCGPLPDPLPEALTPEAVAALIDAATACHSVDVLEKDGKTLVILGESHIKLPIAARAGEEVLRHFPVRVLEGARLPDPPIPEPSDASESKVVDASEIKTREAKSDEQGVVGQSIEEESEGAAEENPKVKIGGVWGTYFNLLHNIKKISGGLIEGSTIHLAEEQKGQIVQGMEVMNIPMEEGHEPTGAEVATFKLMPKFLIATMIIGYGHQFRDSLPGEVARALETAKAILTAQNVISYVDTFSGGRMSDHELGLLVNPISGILHGRSRTMAKNIAKAVDNNDDKKVPILAIMGAAHVHKVMQDLGSDSGFKRVFLPGQHAGEGVIDDIARKVQSDLRLIGKMVGGEKKSGSDA